MEIHHFDGIYQERWGFLWAMLVSGRVLVDLSAMDPFPLHHLINCASIGHYKPPFRHPPTAKNIQQLQQKSKYQNLSPKPSSQFEWLKLLDYSPEKKTKTKTKHLDNQLLEDSISFWNGYLFFRDIHLLVGGFNPFEKYESKWVHLPQISGWK